MWDVILFDLDGTLTDPKEGITKSVAYALEHFGIHVDDPDILTHFIGPPLLESFKGEYHMTDAQAREAIDIYRQRYSTIGWAENQPYSGVDNCLEQLKSNGKILMVATSKAEPYANQILEHFGLFKYFDDICGTALNDLSQSKADVIRNALARKNITDYSKVVMVGDRKHDIIGGHELDIETVGVLYGYGNYDELTRSGADYIAENLNELTRLLC